MGSIQISSSMIWIWHLKYCWVCQWNLGPHSVSATLMMMDGIWIMIMKTIHSQYIKSQQNSEICNVPYAKFKDCLESSRWYQVVISGNEIYQVQNPDTGLKYNIDLKKWDCICKNFQEYLTPCSHVIAACKHDHKDLFNHFSEQYTILAYQEIYRKPMLLIIIQDLRSHPDILLPCIKKLQGRPKIKWHRKKSWNRKSINCRVCEQNWGARWLFPNVRGVD